MAKKKTENTPEADSRAEQLAILFKQSEKNYGLGSIGFAKDFKYGDTPRVTTGVLGLDISLGGGLPVGRISCFYGPKSCLDASSYIPYEIRTVDGRRQNHKGGSIERLFHRVNNIPFPGKGSYQRESTLDSEFLAPSVDEHGRVFMNKIVGVVDAGEQECFEIVVTTGERISATSNHRFYTGSGYTRLGDLAVGDIVTISRNSSPDDKSCVRQSRTYLNVKHHPFACLWKVTPVNERTKTVCTYTYHRLARSRAVVEAEMNSMSLDMYIEKLNSGHLDGLRFLETAQHVHHIDEDHTNDSLSNLAVIDASEHGRMHATERKLGYGYAHEVEIVSITSVGTRRTFDIQMSAPYNNFVADGFIVHNSSKTTCYLRAAGRAQRMCSNCWTPAFPLWTPHHGVKKPSCECGSYRKTNIAWLDVEGVWDDSWAGRFLTVNDIILTQPETGEQASDIADSLLRSGAVDIIVIDSIAMMAPSGEIEKSSADATMGLQARLLGTSFRKFVSGMNLVARRDGRRPTVWYTNQIRSDLKVMFGSPETQPGGFSSGFNSSTQTRFSAGKYEYDKESGIVTFATMKFRNEKNKCGKPKMAGEYRLVLSDTEVKKVGDIQDETYAIKMGKLTGLVTVGAGRAPTVCDGVEFDAKSLLERHWMTTPADYESYKQKLIGLVCSDGALNLRVRDESEPEESENHGSEDDDF